MKLLVLFLALLLSHSLAFAVSPAKTPTDKVNVRIRQQVLQIQREAHLGKLTKDQAKALKAQVETIRKTEMTYLKMNNSKTLTDAQVADLNGQLNTLSKSIPIR